MKDLEGDDYYVEVDSVVRAGFRTEEVSHVRLSIAEPSAVCLGREECVELIEALSTAAHEAFGSDRTQEAT